MGLLDGKVVLVTGGTSGIGRASAELFSREGARIAITGRRAEEGARIAAAIANSGGEAMFIAADLNHTDDIPALVASVVARFGRLDGALNNAGSGGGGSLEKADEAAWQHMVDTNLKTAFFCLKAEAAQMRAQGGGGTIVFTSSVFAQIAMRGSSIYSASKGAVDALTRAAAVELGPFGIRVNAISPSITRTPMTEGRIRKEPDGSESHPYAVNIPLRRLAEPEEIAQAALFLLSDRASYITGHNLVVDGGQSAT